MTTVCRAWEGFAAGRATSYWAAFLETLSDDVTFFISSLGPFQGENHGKHRVKDFALHTARTGSRLKFEKSVRMSREGCTIVFEA